MLFMISTMFIECTILMSYSVAYSLFASKTSLLMIVAINLKILFTI